MSENKAKNPRPAGPSRGGAGEEATAAAETVALVAIGPIEHDGVAYAPGDKFGVPPAIAGRLMELGEAALARAD